MFGHTGFSVGSLARAPRPEQPAFSAPALPLPTPPQQGNLCSWGCCGQAPAPWLWLEKQRLKNEFRSARMKRGSEADRKGGFVDPALGSQRGSHPRPAPETTGWWDPGQMPALSGLRCPYCEWRAPSSVALGLGVPCFRLRDRDREVAYPAVSPPFPGSLPRACPVPSPAEWERGQLLRCGADSSCVWTPCWELDLAVTTGGTK